MRHMRVRRFGFVCAAMLALGMILGGCGASPTTPVGRVSAASTATSTATPFFPTATPPPASAEAPGCPPVGLGPVPPGYGTVGALKVSIPQRWSALDFPDELMPNGEPNAPYQLPAIAVTNFQPNPPVNPSLDTGYALQLCNQTSASHTLTSLSAGIARFTPSSGPVTVWHICGDGPYNAATKQTTPGCGGGFGGVYQLTATFPTTSAGTSAPAATPSGGTILPLAIAPNQSLTFLIAIRGLTSQGTYALDFHVGVDGASPATLAPSDGAFMIAPSPTVWTGTACQAPAMQAHIPAASHDTYYVCPPAP